jgi:tRNA (guanine-N7-)-methyltransferase
VELLDPKEFIITRKRKKYKFALFANSPLCYEFDEWQRAGDVDVAEIGAGNAHFLVELAAIHPEQQFVAVDVKADRLQSGARLATEQGLTNIRFVRARADQVDELFVPRTLGAIWLTFSDPFPRKRSAARRRICVFAA